MTTGTHPAYSAISPRQYRAVGISVRTFYGSDTCEFKKLYACGLVECMSSAVCNFSIDCGDAGLFCRHPSVKYTERMIQALLEFE
jgi:hypothetical protein